MIARIDDHRAAYGASNFTYVATWVGFVYVAFVINSFARHGPASRNRSGVADFRARPGRQATYLNDKPICRSSRR
jgi:hypothetical protein